MSNLGIIKADPNHTHGVWVMPCGCSFPIVDPTKIINGVPAININYDNINTSCASTWTIFSKGYTKGVFQLETNLGRTWAKKAQPKNLNELADLVSILRPGTLKCKLDDKSMTQHYVDRKQGLEQYEYFHPFAEPILRNTYGIMIYQESILEIAKVFAGFNLQEADTLRKSIGKKLADILAQCRQQFIDRCARLNIINEKQSIDLFDNIEKSNRYSFNKCLDLNSIVETPNGFKTIDDICIGESVLAPGKNGDEFVEIIDKHDNGEQELLEVTLSSGKTIECTINHKFLCDGGLQHELWEIIENNYDIVCQDD